MTLADLTAIMSQVARDHPDIVTDEKVRRYILLLVEEGRKLKQLPTIELAPVDFDHH